MPRSRTVLAVLSSVLVTGGACVAVMTVAAPAGAATDPIQSAIDASAAPGHDWQPDPVRYAVSIRRDIPVRMSDGTVLRADVASPADPETNQPVTGHFPVLMTQTPYGKTTAGELGSSAIGIDRYFVQRGYIDVAVDVRGTGASGGRFDLFDPKQTSDGVTLVNWAAALPNANGKVGLHGASYLGINQLLTAGAVGTNSPLKAIFPIVSAHDIYRDTAFMGGIPDAEFDTLYLGGILPATNLLGAVAGLTKSPPDPIGGLKTLLDRVKNLGDYNAKFLLQAYLGGTNAYDSTYWQQRAPKNVLPNVVANHIPAYLVGGEYDLFQRGAPLNYAALQNLASGRPAEAPMTPGQPVTGRYQLLDGPYTHLQVALDSNALRDLQLRWFDTWLRGDATGMAQTPTPLHYYDLGTKTYRQTMTYPFTGATPTTYYFDGARSGSAPSQNDGTLSTSKPAATSGSDPVQWAPVGPTICDRSLDQWAAGALSLATENLTARPCLDDDRLAQVGPTALTYSTTPMTSATRLAGPVSATIYATANTRDTQWVVNVQDVAPDGTSKPLTQGALIGSQRAVDESRSWTVDGRLVRPYHPHTRASVEPVTPGKLTRYDVEVFPTYATIATGHRLRVTVTTTDFPHLLPTPQQLATLIGGRYQVQRTAAAPSSVTVPLIK